MKEKFISLCLIEEPLEPQFPEDFIVDKHEQAQNYELAIQQGFK